MATMDIFNQDAFSSIELLGVVEKMDYNPQFLGSLGIFESKGQRTTTVYIEEKDGTLTLIPVSERGAPLAQLNTEKRNVRSFETKRLAKGDRLMASELQNIRAFGSETELKQVQAEVAGRMFRLQSDMDLTWENMRLGAVQGILTDSDGSVLYNYFTEFGVTQPAEVAMDFDNTTAGNLRPKIEDSIVRPMVRAAKGAFTTGARIVGLCGDTFWDKLVNHPEVRETYLNWAAAEELRGGTAFGRFRYGGVEWVNYRGTDDGSTIAIADTECKLFPVAPGMFKVAWGPAEFLPFINMPGRPVLPMIIPDEKRQAYVDIEEYSYPLFMPTRPATLYRAKSGA